MSRPLVTAALLALAAIGTPLDAAAQIYTWRDARGTLVLSSRPAGHAVRTFAVPDAPSVRTTVPARRRVDAGLDRIILDESAAQGVRADLVRAVIQVESAFNPRARSTKGALGLMQLMPGTAADLGVRDAFDPRENIRGGVAYLRSLLDRYDRNEELALAAYNAGPGSVEKYGRQVPPYRETRDYVARVTKMTRRGGSRSGLLYRTSEDIGGRRIYRYTNVRPSSGAYDVIDTRR
jgi:soluble lytic murein transglycosylase-like protein